MGALRFRVLADVSGLGKTLTALLVIVFATVRDQQEENFSGYKATLIIVPSCKLHNWIDESRKWLPSLEIWTLCSGKIDGTEGFDSLPKLMQNLQELDKQDPATGKVVVISTYSSWEKLSITIDEKSRNKRHEKEKIPVTKRKTNYSVKDAKPLADYEFRRIILDEGTNANDPSSRINISLQLTKAGSMLYISVSTFDNSIRDIYGVLALMRNYIIPSPDTHTTTKEITGQDYEKFCKEWDSKVKTFTRSLMHSDQEYTTSLKAAESEEEEKRLHGFYNAKGNTASSRYGLFLFQEDTVRTIFETAKKENGNRLPATLVESVLGALMRPLLLKRRKDSYLQIGPDKKNPHLVSPNDQIPKSTWYFIDLAMSAADDQVYQSNFAFLHAHHRSAIIINKRAKEDDHHQQPGKSQQRRGRNNDDENDDGSGLNQEVVDRLTTIAASSLPLATLSRRMALIRYYRRPAAPTSAVMSTQNKKAKKTDNNKHDDDNDDNDGSKQARPSSDRYPLPSESLAYADHNTTFFLKLINTAAEYTAPFSRADAAMQLTTSSVKLQFAARRILESDRHRLIIFVSYPLTQMVLESLATTMEIQVSQKTPFSPFLILFSSSSSSSSIPSYLSCYYTLSLFLSFPGHLTHQIHLSSLYIPVSN